MKFDIKEIEGLSGEKAHIYSVQLKGEEQTLLEQFFDENSKYATDLKEIFNKLRLVGCETGCRRQWFKMNEGCSGDGVAALWYGQLRLYCLYFDKTAVFLVQEDINHLKSMLIKRVPELNAKVQQMKEIAKIINQAIIDKDIVISEDGELTINYWDNDED